METFDSINVLYHISNSQESVKLSNNCKQPNLLGYKQSNPSLNTNWGRMSGISTQVNEVYDEITKWRKNVFYFRINVLAI